MAPDELTNPAEQNTQELRERIQNLMDTNQTLTRQRDSTRSQLCKIKTLVCDAMKEMDYDDLCSSGRTFWKELAPLVGYFTEYIGVEISVKLDSFEGDPNLDGDDFEVRVWYRDEEITIDRMSVDE